KIKNKIDDLDFEIEVLSLTNPDDLEAQTDLLVKKVVEMTRHQKYLKTLQGDLNKELDKAVKKYGSNSEQAKAIRDELYKVGEELEDVTIGVLRAEREIK